MCTDVHVFVNTRTKDSAALLFIISGKITSATDERDSKRGLRDNHAPKVANVNKVELSIMSNNDNN